MHGMMQVKLSVSQKLNILSAVPPLRCQQPSKPSSLAVGRSKPCDARQGRHRVEGFQNYEKSSFVRRHQRDVIPFRWQRLHRRWQIRNGANGAASPCGRRVVTSQRSCVIHQSTTAIWTAAGPVLRHCGRHRRDVAMLHAACCREVWTCAKYPNRREAPVCQNIPCRTARIRRPNYPPRIGKRTIYASVYQRQGLCSVFCVLYTMRRKMRKKMRKREMQDDDRCCFMPLIF